MGRLALVLSGGGARGAYEAGVVHYIRTGLPKEIASRHFEIQCGSSAGAINTAAMVSMAEDPVAQGNKIKELWLSLKQDDIYQRDFSAALNFLKSSITGIFRNLATFNLFELGKRKGPHLYSFLDTKPLHAFLKKNIPWQQLEKNVQKGPVAAVSVTATNTRSGRSELFICKKSEIEYEGDYRHHEVALQAEHVMASSAIPIVFPTIKIDKTYYADGGIRLFTPMSPAIQLGADRIVIVGLRHRPTSEEIKTYDGQEMRTPPSLVELMGRLMNGFFLDRIQFDLEQLQRINALIDWSEKLYGKDYLDRLNQFIQKKGEPTDIAKRGIKQIRVVEILPSEFISEIFSRWFQKQRKKGSFKLSTLERLLTRVLDIDAPGAIELFSYLTFANDYIKELIDLGYEDAKKNRERLIELMSS
jgi:NTE family protein